ncbi:MAG: hypothetical protein KDN20_08580 [Verrucomicrobiae bacterium]|nr:hypothetical protein [Verrucomicrobiae bacterium]
MVFPRPQPPIFHGFQPASLPCVLIAGLAIFFGARSPGWAAEEPLALLQRNCLRCHTEDKRKGGLVMTNREAIIAGGDSGPSAKPGHSGGSLLVETLFPDADPHMPPKGQLEPSQIIALETWIDQGMPWDDALWEKLLTTPLDGPVTLTALPKSYQPVFGLALSPDGKSLVAGRGNRLEWFSIQIDESAKAASATLAEIGKLEPGPDTIQSLAWSPDGKTLAVGSFRRITFWDAATQEKRSEITAELSGRISALAFSPDSKTLHAADSVDAVSGRLLSIDPVKATITRTTKAHGDAIFSIAVSSDGKLAATASADKNVKVWNLADGKLMRQLEGHTGYVLAAAFSPENDRLGTAGDDEEIKIWRLDTGKKISSFGGTRTGPITALTWTSDPAKTKQKSEEKDKEKAAAINTDRIISVNEGGQPRVYTDLNEHEGEQRSTGAKEKAVDTADTELASLVYDPATHRFFAGSTRGDILGWDENGKLTIRLTPASPLAQATP